MPSDRSRVIVDADTGVDDALALILAVKLENIELIGVTTVAGNAALTATTENALRILNAISASAVPVFPGAHSPLVRPFEPATDYHGFDGLGGFHLPKSTAKPQSVHAPEFLIQSAVANPGQLTLVCLGPLTNLAVALRLRPDLPSLFRRLVLMGGAYRVAGNKTGFAEFNIWADPEAASIVVRSGFQTTFVGLDVTHRAIISRAEWASLSHSERPLTKLVFQLLRRNFDERKKTTFALHDPLTVAVVAKPELVSTEQWSVKIDTGISETAGQSMLVAPDHRHLSAVAFDLNTAEFNSLWRGALELDS